MTIVRQVARYGHQTKCNESFIPIFTLASQLPDDPWEKTAVLRITVVEDSNQTRFVVEGKLMGECVRELEKCWHAVGSKHADKSILVDLSSVSFIDDGAKKLLADMHCKGIAFVATGLLPRCLIQELEAEE